MARASKRRPMGWPTAGGEQHIGFALEAAQRFCILEAAG